MPTREDRLRRERNRLWRAIVADVTGGQGVKAMNAWQQLVVENILEDYETLQALRVALREKGALVDAEACRLSPGADQANRLRTRITNSLEYLGVNRKGRPADPSRELRGLMAGETPARAAQPKEPMPTEAAIDFENEDEELPV